MLTTSNLNQIKDLCEYLNRAFVGDLSADVQLHDSNGNYIGKVRYSAAAGEYVFEMA